MNVEYSRIRSERSPEPYALRVIFVRPDGYVESLVDVTDIRDAFDIFQHYEWCRWHAYPLAVPSPDQVGMHLFRTLRVHRTARMWDLCTCCSKYAADCRCHVRYHVCKREDL